MLTRIILAASLALGLTACGDLGTIARPSIEDQARTIVAPIVETTVPGQAGQVLTQCVIDNATTEELTQIIAVGAGPLTTAKVTEILARESTIACGVTGLAF